MTVRYASLAGSLAFPSDSRATLETSVLLSQSPDNAFWAAANED
jgi:hypothetical protein